MELVSYLWPFCPCAAFAGATFAGNTHFPGGRTLSAPWDHMTAASLVSVPGRPAETEERSDATEASREHVGTPNTTLPFIFM